MAATPQMANNPANFATAVLEGLGITPTPTNVTNMQVWMTAEGGGPNNPLNVRQPNGGFSVSDPQTGVQDTVSVLNQSNMSMIKAALAADQSLSSFTAAVIASPWDAGHYAGSGFAAGQDQPLQSFPNPTGLIGQLTVDNPIGGALGLNAGQVSQSLSGLAGLEASGAKLLGTVTSASFWERIGIFTLGATVFGIALVVFMANTKPGQKAVSSAESGATVAALA